MSHAADNMDLAVQGAGEDPAWADRRARDRAVLVDNPRV